MNFITKVTNKVKQFFNYYMNLGILGKILWVIGAFVSSIITLFMLLMFAVMIAMITSPESFDTSAPSISVSATPSPTPDPEPTTTKPTPRPTATSTPSPTPTPTVEPTPEPQPDPDPNRNYAPAVPVPVVPDPVPTYEQPVVPVAPVAPPQPSYFKNCTEVRAAGAGPITPLHPAWDPKFDADGNGVGCE